VLRQSGDDGSMIPLTDRRLVRVNQQRDVLACEMARQTRRRFLMGGPGRAAVARSAQGAIRQPQRMGCRVGLARSLPPDEKPEAAFAVSGSVVALRVAGGP